MCTSKETVSLSCNVKLIGNIRNFKCNSYNKLQFNKLHHNARIRKHAVSHCNRNMKIFGYTSDCTKYSIFFDIILFFYFFEDLLFSSLSIRWYRRAFPFCVHAVKITRHTPVKTFSTTPTLLP